jgi:hypothetical protein
MDSNNVPESKGSIRLSPHIIKLMLDLRGVGFNVNARHDTKAPIDGHLWYVKTDTTEYAAQSTPERAIVFAIGEMMREMFQMRAELDEHEEAEEERWNLSVERGEQEDMGE